MHILTTKLNRPLVDGRWVPRPRLIAPLFDALLADGPDRRDSRGVIFQLEQEKIIVPQYL